MKYFYLYTKIDPNAENNSNILPVLKIKYGQENVQKEAPLSVLKLYPSFVKSNLKIAGRSGGGVYSGDIIDAVINVTNDGNIEANNVVVNLVLSNLFVLNEGQLSWNIEKLKVGETISFNSSLKIVDGITKDSYASCYLKISSEEIEPFESKKYSILVSGERPFTRNYIPIVGIHGVEPNPQGPYEISTAAFDYLCGTLNAMGYKTITFMDLLNYLERGKQLPEKPVIITSDDGYYDTYAYAFPILQKYGFKMTVFLVTGVIGNSDGDRRVNEFDSGLPNTPTRPMLIWPEIGVMSKYGCEFLSHSVSHKNFGGLSTEEALYEMIQSRVDIESHLKKPVPFIAWPRSNFSSVDVDLLPQAGYRGAVKYIGGIEDVRTINIYGIKRVIILARTSTSSYASLLGLE